MRGEERMDPFILNQIGGLAPVSSGSGASNSGTTGVLSWSISVVGRIAIATLGAAVSGTSAISCSLTGIIPAHLRPGGVSAYRMPYFGTGNQEMYILGITSSGNVTLIRYVDTGSGLTAANMLGNENISTVVIYAISGQRA